MATVTSRMIWRKLHHEFPVFFAYAVFHLIKAATLLAITAYGNRYQYFYGYWIGELGSLILGFLVVQELYWKVFREYEGLQQLGVTLFRWAMLLLMFIAMATVPSQRAIDEDRIMLTILVFQRSLRLVQDGLLVLLFVMTPSLGLRFRHYALGIAIGFAVFASVDLAAVAAWARFGEEASHFYGLIRPIAYNCALLVWVVYFFRPEAQPLPVNRVPNTQMEKWNEAIVELWRR